MGNNMKLFKVGTFLIWNFLLMLSLIDCSQARRGLVPDQEYTEQQLCQNIEDENNVYFCGRLAANVTQNEVVITVDQLGFDAGDSPYRILVRRYGESTFHVLADNIDYGEGAQFAVGALSGHFIEEYEEWVIESTMQLSEYGEETAIAGEGLILAHDMISWQELEAEANQ